MEQLTYRAAVIGAGAAGLTAAAAWGRRCGKGQVVLLEKQPKTGRKLLATGNGRCNISNEGVSPSHYHGDRQIIESVLSRCSVSDLRAYFQSLGVWLRADSEDGSTPTATKPLPYGKRWNGIVGIRAYTSACPVPFVPSAKPAGSLSSPQTM